MTNEALERVVRLLGKRRPFRKYAVAISGGPRLVVTHPEAIRRVGDVFVYRAPDGDLHIFDGLNVCEVVDHASVEP